MHFTVIPLMHFIVLEMELWNPFELPIFNYFIKHFNR